MRTTAVSIPPRSHPGVYTMATARFTRVAVLLAVMATAGCGGGTPAGNFAQVTGTVTQGGVPLDGGMITFHATTGDKGQLGKYFALTDSSGKYVLLANGKDPGIPPGMYKVTITKQGFKAANAASADIQADQGQVDAQLSANAALGKNAMPKEYEDPAKTKLSVTLESGKNTDKNFDIPK